MPAIGFRRPDAVGFEPAHDLALETVDGPARLATVEVDGPALDDRAQRDLLVQNHGLRDTADAGLDVFVVTAETEEFLAEGEKHPCIGVQPGATGVVEYL